MLAYEAEEERLLAPGDIDAATELNVSGQYSLCKYKTLTTKLG